MFSISCVLRKLEHSCKIRSVCAAIFRKAPEIKWQLLSLSSLPYRGSFTGIMCMLILLLLNNKLSQKKNKRTKPGQIRNRMNSILKRTTI